MQIQGSLKTVSIRVGGSLRQAKTVNATPDMSKIAVPVKRFIVCSPL